MARQPTLSYRFPKLGKRLHSPSLFHRFFHPFLPLLLLLLFFCFFFRIPIITFSFILCYITLPFSSFFHPSSSLSLFNFIFLLFLLVLPFVLPFSFALLNSPFPPKPPLEINKYIFVRHTSHQLSMTLIPLAERERDLTQHATTVCTSRRVFADERRRQTHTHGCIKRMKGRQGHEDERKLLPPPLLERFLPRPRDFRRVTLQMTAAAFHPRYRSDIIVGS